MGPAFLEILVEPIIELALYVLTAVVAIAVAEAWYSVWVGVRWVISSDGRSEFVTDGQDATWRIRVTWRPWPGRWQISRRLFGLRTAGARRAVRSRTDWLHPAAMAERFDDALILILPFVLAVLAILVAVFIVETVVVVFVLSLALAWRFVTRRTWRVEITDPKGSTQTITGLDRNEAQQTAATWRTEVRVTHL